MANRKDLYYLSNAYGTMIFNMNEDIYQGTDGNIYIGSCEQEVFGTSDAAEGYAEEIAEDVSDIKNYFKAYDAISKRTDQGDYKLVDREDFINKAVAVYEDLARENDKDM